MPLGLQTVLSFSTNASIPWRAERAQKRAARRIQTDRAQFPVLIIRRRPKTRRQNTKRHRLLRLGGQIFHHHSSTGRKVARHPPGSHANATASNWISAARFALHRRRIKSSGVCSTLSKRTNGWLYTFCAQHTSRLFRAWNNTERGELLLVRGLTRHKSGRIKFKGLVFSARFFGNTNLVLFAGLGGSQNFL